MAIEKMRLINIVGKYERLSAAAEVGSDEDFHPEKAMTFLEDVSGYTAVTEENPYVEMIARLEELSENHSPSLTYTDYDGGKLSEEKTVDFITAITDEFNRLEDEKQELIKLISEDEIGISHLANFTGLDVKLSEVFACRYVKVRFGRIPRDSYPKLSVYENNPYLLFFPCGSDATHYWGVYFCPDDEAPEIDRIFSHLYFERLRVPGVVGTPEEGIEGIKKNLTEKRQKLKELSECINQRWQSEFDRIQHAYALILHLNNAHEIKCYAARDGSLFHLVGWIPEKREQMFKKRFEEISNIECVIESPLEEGKNEPPIRLKNNRFSRPFEMFVDMFGLPAYNELDPTLFVSITFSLIFGIMLGDLGQGLLLSAVGFWMNKKKNMQIGRVLFRLGFVSAVFGVIYGSVFGTEKLLDGILKKATGLTSFKVMEPDNIIMILLISVGLGVVFCIISMMMNIFVKLRQRRFGEAVCSQSGLAGLVFYASLIGGVGAAIGFGKNIINLPYILCLIVLPLLIILFKGPLSRIIDGRKDWKKWKVESVGGYLTENIFELIEYLLSYVSNTISFLRVGAFALVHAGMMLAFFSMADMFMTNIILWVIIIIIGNIFVTALEALMVSIQCMRLEYYEMFSRFYEGGGSAFMSVRQRLRGSQSGDSK